MFLRSWWSRIYNRPLKDPLLQDYTLEELYYEYRDHVERKLAAEESAEEATDSIEQAKIDEAVSWADQEEANELKAQAEADSEPRISEQDRAWMNKAMEQAKEEFGQDFGEDIEETF